MEKKKKLRDFNNQIFKWKFQKKKKKILSIFKNCNILHSPHC